MQFSKLPFLVLVPALLLTGCAGSGAAPSTEATAETDAADDSVTTSSPAPSTFPPLDSAVEFADRLLRELEAFELQRQETRSRIQTATDAALSTVTNTPSAGDLRDATRAWRQDWNAARAAMHDLDRSFADVEAAAVRYFNHLDRQTSRISNDSLRSAERSQNERLNQRWQNAIVRARGNLQGLHHRLQQGNDLYVTMLNASLRSGFGENVEALQEIDEDASSLLEELQQLTQSGQRLVIDDASGEAEDAPATAESDGGS
jgi:predicted RNase H-like nuclease (RuvC/YqgF family)